MADSISWCPYFAFDLEARDLLPINWKTQIENVAQTKAILTILDGKSETSRETNPEVQLPISVVTGDVVRDSLPWLFNLYEGTLCDLACQAIGRKVFPSTDIKSAININVLTGAEARYEWHVDSNPLTGILFVSGLSAADGGELLFKQDDRECLVLPLPGLFIAFDAREIPHTVLPLRRSITRISVPMNYYDERGISVRPSDLDEYLFTERPKK